MKSLRLGLLAAVFVASTASATKPDPKPEDQPPAATSTSNAGSVSASAALAGAVSGAHSGSLSGSNSNSSADNQNEINANSSNDIANNTDVSNRQGQGQGQDQGQQQGQVTVNDNDYEYQEAFHAGRGILIPVDCGAAFDTGGANKSGAAFLGIAFTTPKCYTMKAGNAFAAMGEYEIACELYADVARRSLKRRKAKVDCNEIARRIVVRQEKFLQETPQVPPDVVDRKEFQETIDRVFKTTQTK